jgi:hypothetical protein
MVAGKAVGRLDTRTNLRMQFSKLERPCGLDARRAFLSMIAEALGVYFAMAMVLK